MSTEQLQRDLNSLDKEIVELEKKKAQKDKEICSYQEKILSIQKSINKNTSVSMLKSKQNQISGYQNNINRYSKDSSDLLSKIAQKRQKRNDVNIKLQKSQADDNKKQEKIYKDMQKMYEKRIADLSNSMNPIRYIPNANSIDHVENDFVEYDVFVSHAWEDKKDFTDEFVEELKKQGLKVWYDTDKLKWGDSMREKIDNGLSKSRYGVVILSPNYIAEQKYWTKAELNGLFQAETINGKTILPIWHNLTKKQVTEYSPIIADRKAMTTALMTAEEIAKELKNLFSSNDKEDPNNDQT